ncbi:quinol monooxygenase YgiN [Kineococcus radiotolerans]|nr:antibiotic biosynthesis monooxygenase [Kineococcus radiotolerans]MBB2903462.1 quinol monooxygenase YgiN [Kineococcus radiotolerans]
MTITYGFTSTMTAKPGLGDRVVDLLLSGLEPGNPASSEHCLLYVVSRSASDPDVVHVAEGWSSEEEHHRVFATPAAAAIVAGFAELLAADAASTDLVPVRGKAVL